MPQPGNRQAGGSPHARHRTSPWEWDWVEARLGCRPARGHCVAGPMAGWHSCGVAGAETEGPGGLKWGPGPWAGWGEPQGRACRGCTACESPQGPAVVPLPKPQAQLRAR